MASDLLFELGTEELPSGSVWPLAESLANNLMAGLKDAELTFGLVKPYATPRRIAVLIKDVQETQPDQTIIRKGPVVTSSPGTVNEPSPALQGFARSCGVSVDELSQTHTDKGAWWVYETIKPGADTKTLLPDLIAQAVAGLSIPKPMRWGSTEDEFARPVHWAVLLLGNEVIETSLLGVTTGQESMGHRFHHPKRVHIASPTDYEDALREAFVLPDFFQRKQLILEKVTQLATEHQFNAIMPEALVDEVTSIVEWPEPLLARFEPEFLEVPAESLIASMQAHQKCFALQDAKGHLQPYFITVSNIKSEAPEHVVAGNEKVMRARLSDASFFYKQDKKKPLSDYIPATETVVFQARLGTLADKAKRIQTLMEALIQPLGLEKSHALRAAELCKCDLMTGMVGEFPELQGVMGYYYAKNDNEPESVAIALKEQYWPRFSGDNLPSTDLGSALSLADRLDTLVGIFAIGQKPTGVKDPFKLRRHALAVVRILITTPATMNLSTLVQQAWHGYDKSLKLDKKALEELIPFILERMQSYYFSQGVSQDIVQAVRARQEDWLYDTDMRIKALMDFVHLPEAISLSAACKRVNNILQKADLANNLEVKSELLQEAEEKALFEQIQEMEQFVKPLYLIGNYEEILSHLAILRDPVDAFFDKVLVMALDEALKINRLSLLARLQVLLQGVADISLLTIKND
ncbi:glycine--tRNA ligase subunit beta [Legionella impletisoli]|uniref:Glycine--tRNA ligase beta subunit n=1 Tax=Legionella impletisoli TaxID=343510 RepID=A0A917JP16_9GAMM|nr:glycine--tRNA ligase subunit beta [Legionella impletisoli]GGI79140.1 glycine--tRNA ligase beta subunit [Legionella impletisoli]